MAHPRPKPTPPSPASYSVPRWAVVLLVILLIIAFVVGVLFYKQHQKQAKIEKQYQADKATFVQVEANMLKVYDAITAKAGRPDFVKKTNSCDHVSQVYGEGQLYCESYYDFAYKDGDYNVSSRRAVNIKQAVIDAKTFLIKEDSFIVMPNNKSDGPQDGFRLLLHTKDTTSCELNFDYDLASSNSAFSSLEPNEISMFSLVCSKNMQKPIYPLAH